MATRKTSKAKPQRKRTAHLRAPARKLTTTVDIDVTVKARPEPSPVEAATLELINASEETERLVYDLRSRLTPILRKSDEEIAPRGWLDTGIPLVDGLHARANHIRTTNAHLLDLLDRLAT